MIYLKLREGVKGVASPELFSRWRTENADTDIAQKILEGWSQVRRAIESERWRETYFKLIYHAIFGFNIPPHPNCLDRLTACLKCALPKLIYYIVFGPALTRRIFGDR